MTRFLCMSENKQIFKNTHKKSFFSANKFAELLLFSIRLFEMCPTFLKLSIVGAKKCHYCKYFYSMGQLKINVPKTGQHFMQTAILFVCRLRKIKFTWTANRLCRITCRHSEIKTCKLHDYRKFIHTDLQVFRKKI